MSSSQFPKDQEIAPEYRFDYTKAKPNRFAEKLKEGWTVEKFVEDETREIKKSSKTVKKSPAKAKKKK